MTDIDRAPHRTRAILELEPDDRAPAVARRFCRQVLGERCSDDVTVIASELVTNGVLHARTELAVTVDHGDGWVRVAVEDHNPRVPAAAGAPVDATTGRGLHLVQELAAVWGVDMTTTGKVVWAELAVS